METYSNSKKKVATYKEGIAIFGNDESALYCHYVYAIPSSASDDWKYVIKFGGENNYVISTESQYKTIFRVDTDERMTVYSIFHSSGSEHINIIGKQSDGKWVNYIDSKVLSKQYFGGNESYKASDGVHYSLPQFQGDVIIIPYKYQVQFKVVSEGEFRFKWDESASGFGIEQIVY